MSVTPGYHKIKTHTGKYLTLAAQNDPLTAATPTGAHNQIWDFQPSGIYWTIRNTGYTPSAYAYSTGVSGTSVSGHASATEWAIIPHNNVYSIQYGRDTSNACSLGSNDQVNLGPTQLVNPMQQFSFE